MARLLHGASCCAHGMYAPWNMSPCHGGMAPGMNEHCPCMDAPAQKWHIPMPPPGMPMLLLTLMPCSCTCWAAPHASACPRMLLHCVQSLKRKLAARKAVVPWGGGKFVPLKLKVRS